MNNILEGIKVLDLSNVLAGPSVGMFLGELGAEVLKIENPDGDITRQWKSPFEDSNESISAYYASVNAFKRIECLNLNEVSNVQKIYSLVHQYDIVITNFKFGDDKKFGLDFNTIKKINPKIIYGQISGYGKDEERVAFDLVLQAETGFMYLNRWPEQLPNKMPVALIDVLAAHHLKEGILLALYNRLKTGKGAYVHCSLYDAAICSLMNQAVNYLVAGYNPLPMGSKHPNIAPYGEIFETNDKRLITIAIGNDKQFKTFCEIINGMEMAANPYYSTNQSRVKHRTTLYNELQNKIKHLSSEFLYTNCIDKRVPIAIIKDIAEVMQDPYTKKLIKPVVIQNKPLNIITSIAFDII